MSNFIEVHNFWQHTVKFPQYRFYENPVTFPQDVTCYDLDRLADMPKAVVESW